MVVGAIVNRHLFGGVDITMQPMYASIGLKPPRTRYRAYGGVESGVRNRALHCGGNLLFRLTRKGMPCR